MVGRRWRELGLLMPLSGFQLGCGLLPELTQDSDHVRANMPLVLEQHSCCVLHRDELARIGVRQVPASARPRAVEGTIVSIPNGAVVPLATTILRPAPGNQGIVRLLECFCRVAALERLGNLVVMTIWGGVRCSFTTNCHQPIAVTVPRDRA